MENRKLLLSHSLFSPLCRGNLCLRASMPKNERLLSPVKANRRSSPLLGVGSENCSAESKVFKNWQARFKSSFWRLLSGLGKWLHWSECLFTSHWKGKASSTEWASLERVQWPSGDPVKTGQCSLPPPTILGGRWYYSHFIAGETEAQRRQNMPQVT